MEFSHQFSGEIPAVSAAYHTIVATFKCRSVAYGNTTPVFQFWDKGESSENYWKSEVNIAHMYVPLKEGGGGVNRYSIIPDFRSNGDHSL